MTVALIVLALPATVAILAWVLVRQSALAADERRELIARVQNPDLARAQAIARLAPPSTPEPIDADTYAPAEWDDDLALAGRQQP